MIKKSIKKSNHITYLILSYTNRLSNAIKKTDE